MLELIYGNDYVQWDDSTMVLYIFLVLFSILVGYMFKNNNKRGNIFFFLLFLVLFIISAFRDIGTDLPVYKSIFEDSRTIYVKDYNNEPGFIFINRIIALFTSNSDVAIGVFSFLSLFLIYRTIQYYKQEFDIQFCLFAFVGLFYFQSFNLLRIYFTSYILCYFFKYMIRGSTKKYLVIIALCTLIHYSAILMLLPGVFYILYTKSHRLFWIGISVIIIFIIVLLPYLEIFNIFDRYSSYLQDSALNFQNNKFGVAQFLFHSPLYVLYYYSRKRLNNRDVDLLLVYTTFSLLYACLGYKILMIGRVSIYYIVIYVIIIPRILFQLKLNHYKNLKLIKFFIILILLLRIHLYFVEYLYLDSLMPYKTIF